MQTGLLKESSLWVKLLLLIVAMLLSTALFIGLWAVLFGADTQSLMSLRWMQALQSFGTFAAPCFLVALLFSERPSEFLSLRRLPSWQGSLFVFVFMLLALPGVNLIGWLNQQMVLPDFMSSIEQAMLRQEEAAAALIERFMTVDTIWGLFGNIFLMALLPAFAEELFFRGTLQRLFAERISKATAIWVCAIIFSAIHFQFYGFVPRMLLGALFGYLLVWSRSLWLPVLAHFTNNVSVVILYYIFSKQGYDTEVLDTFGTGPTLWLGLLSLLVILVGLVLMKHKKIKF